MKILTLLIILIATFSGCRSTSPEVATEAQFFWENPEALPEFISHIFIGGEKMCVDVRLTYYTNETASLSLHELADTVNYVLDGNAVEPGWFGSNRHFLQSCIDIRLLSIGIHKITITVEDFAGNTADYSWAFHIKRRLLGLTRDEIHENVVLPIFPD